MKRVILLAVLALAVMVTGDLLWQRYRTPTGTKPGELAGTSGTPEAGNGAQPAAGQQSGQQAGGAPSRRQGGQGGGAGGGRRGGADPNVPVAVVAEPAKSQDVPVELDAIGTATPLAQVTVRSQVSGQLLDVLFKEGQDVKKGDLLARVDPVSYQAAYDQTVAKKAQDEALLENARRDLERYIRLAETNSIARQQADTQRSTVAQLEAQVRADQASIDSAKATLDNTRILAPIDGRTGVRLVDSGNLVSSSDTTGIVVIAQIRPISVVFNVPQQQLPRIIAGQAKAPLQVVAVEPETQARLDTGKLTVVDNQVDQTTGTVKLKAEFPNTDLRLWPGSFATVRLRVETLAGVTTVPAAAIQRGPKGPYVFLVEGDHVVQREVKLTRQDDRLAVIAEGVKPGEPVVTVGFARLTDGAKVTVSGPEALASPDRQPTVDGGARRQGGGRRNQGQQGQGQQGQAQQGAGAEHQPGGAAQGAAPEGQAAPGSGERAHRRAAGSGADAAKPADATAPAPSDVNAPRPTP